MEENIRCYTNTYTQGLITRIQAYTLLVAHLLGKFPCFYFQVTSCVGAVSLWVIVIAIVYSFYSQITLIRFNALTALPDSSKKDNSRQAAKGRRCEHTGNTVKIQKELQTTKEQCQNGRDDDDDK